MSSYEVEVYQLVTPGEPEAKGRSCLNGETEDEDNGAGAVVVATGRCSGA